MVVKNAVSLAILLLCLLYSTNFSIGATTNLRIINGTDAVQGEFPFMVSLRNHQGEHFCGSSIISPVWVLTAAHCVYGRNPKGLSVQYGAVDISSSGENVINISQVNIHNNYDGTTYENDIALLKLDGFLQFNENVQAVKLGLDELPPNTPVELIGWGRTQSNAQTPKRLQKVNLFIIDLEKCSQIHFNQIFESNICVGVPGGGKGQCTGDSGGPLLRSSLQYGITSWSVKPCGLDPYPGIQTKISHFIRWIERISGVKNLII